MTPLREVRDARGLVAHLAAHDDGARTRVDVASARSLLTPAEAALVVAAVERLGGDVLELGTVDPIVRRVARRAGFVGGLRAPLRRATDAGTGASSRAPEDPEVAIGRWLPETTIDVRPASAPRRFLRLLATGLDRAGRVTARRRNAEATVIAPLGPDLLDEAVASTLDTLLELHTRLGPVAHRIPPVRFTVADSQIAGGTVAGANAGAGIVLSAMYVDAAALSRIRSRRDARIGLVAAARRPRSQHFAVDLTVVHEVGHSVDQAVGSGRLSDTVAARRALGAAVGVESIELALRADWADARDEWKAARARLVSDLSAYATTNCVELFAEAFVAWFLREETPIAAATDAVLRERYPALP